jgi:hypothetical protein
MNLNKSLHFDIIIIDEAQDMTSLYYEFLCKLLRDKNNNILDEIIGDDIVLNNNDNNNFKICVLGDKYQSINEYMDADSRYITLFSKLMRNVNNFEWIELKLNTTFRLTKQMVKFVNRVILRENRLIPFKNINRDSVYYTIYDKYKQNYVILNDIRYLFKCGYSCDDIYIITNSIKGKRHLKMLVNLLKKNNINVYLRDEYNKEVSDQLTQNKINIVSFNQTKGLEKKVIIVMDFDESYLYYDKEYKQYLENGNNEWIPNIFYVALSRAQEKLYIYHHMTVDKKDTYNHDFLPFVNRKNLDKFATVRIKSLDIDYTELKNVNDYKNINMKNDLYVDSKTLVKFLSYNAIRYIINNHLDIRVINNSESDTFYIEGISQQNGIYEDVNNINILSILINYSKNLKDYTYLNECEKESNQCELINNYIENDDIKSLLKISIIYESIKSKFNHKVSQIENYDWVKREDYNEANERLNELFNGNKLTFSYNIKDSKQSSHNIYLESTVDIIEKINDGEFYKIGVTTKSVNKRITSLISKSKNSEEITFIKKEITEINELVK